jgi:hypothetical protein
VALLARICSACSNLSAIIARKQDNSTQQSLYGNASIDICGNLTTLQENATMGSYTNLGFLPGRSATAVMEALQFACIGHDLDADDVLGSFLLRAFM